MHGDLLEVRGERHEYELNMLIYAKQRSIPDTIVVSRRCIFNNNEGSYRTVAIPRASSTSWRLVQHAMSASG